jgi:hypothetical protein
LELYHGNLEQNLEEILKQPLFCNTYPEQMGPSLGTTLTAYVYLPKLVTPELKIYVTQLSKHGKPWKTHVFQKTNQGRLVLGKESWTTFNGTLEPLNLV